MLRSQSLELLAPAGDWEAMRAAVANGADAVYFGLNNFNARHRAANFEIAELPRVMAFLHDHNVRGYATFNTLIFSDELPEAVKAISAIAAAGADAIIVQDLGLARLIHHLCPSLAVHGSTQMTLTEPLAIEFVRGLGVQRVILARELSCKEIGLIAQATKVPLEVFVHGALCIAYSGQCLTNEALGGRSANRGQCAQACRLPYELIVDGQAMDLGDRAYLLSPQDLAAHDLVADLAKLGVECLKIEGRLKSPHYVAATTQSYRSAIDAAATGTKFNLSGDQQRDLAQSFSRGFTHGFLDGVNHQRLIHARFPKSRGLRVGKVIGTTGQGLLISFTGRQIDLKPGDGIVLDEGHPEQDEQGGRVFSVKLIEPGVAEMQLGRGDCNLNAVADVALVWKTDDPAVRRRLEQTYNRPRVSKRVPLHLMAHAGVDRPLRIVLNDDHGHRADVESDQPLQRAQKHELSEELLREQFARLGDTPFELATVALKCEGAVMAPKSVLNDLRRRAVEKLLQLRQRNATHPIAHADALADARQQIAGNFARQSIDQPQLHVLVRDLQQLEAVLEFHQHTPLPDVYCEFEDVRRYKEAVRLAKAADLPVGLATLRIIKPTEHGLLRHLLDCEPDLLLVRNLGSVALARTQAPNLPLIADYSFNIANELTASLIAEQGVRRMVPSYDLNFTQLAAMLRHFAPDRFEVVIHQHMPMFHLEHCVFSHLLSDGTDYRTCGRPCEAHAVNLRDRAGAAHPLMADVGCRNTVYNGTAQSAAEFIPALGQLGIAHFRVELLRQDKAGAQTILTHYTRLLTGEESPRAVWRQLKVLNQFGVTRGTLT